MFNKYKIQNYFNINRKFNIKHLNDINCLIKKYIGYKGFPICDSLLKIF